MSSFQNAAWIRRLWALAQPGDPVAQYVGNVQVVNDRAYASSRERAPYAAHEALLTAPAAGTHNFLEIGGLDQLGATLNLLHRLQVEHTSSGLALFCMLALADGAALTTATRVATTPRFLDADPDVVPQLFLGTITTANIPASATSIPRSTTLGSTAATPTFDQAVTEILPLPGVHVARSWLGPRNLMLFAPDAAYLAFRVAWQAVRA